MRPPLYDNPDIKPSFCDEAMFEWFLAELGFECYFATPYTPTIVIAARRKLDYTSDAIDETLNQHRVTNNITSKIPSLLGDPLAGHRILCFSSFAYRVAQMMGASQWPLRYKHTASNDYIFSISESNITLQDGPEESVHLNALLLTWLTTERHYIAGQFAKLYCAFYEYEWCLFCIRNHSPIPLSLLKYLTISLFPDNLDPLPSYADNNRIYYSPDMRKQLYNKVFLMLESDDGFDYIIPSEIPGNRLPYQDPGSCFSHPQEPPPPY